MQCKIEMKPISQGWEILYSDLISGEPLRDAQGQAITRVLHKRTEDSRTFPILAPDDTALVAQPNTPNAQLHADLIHPQQPTTLSEAYAAVVGQDGITNGVLKFGRYLFDCLLGDLVWGAILKQANSEPIELALTWPANDGDLNRLPWEAMNFGVSPDSKDYWNGFLSAIPRLSITRRVKGALAQPPAFETPPRVLFVVGSKLNYDEIKPGAEFLGLIRSLERNGLYLSSRVLLEADLERIATAVEDFRPNVVHFICHGRTSAGIPKLVLSDPDKPNDSKEVDLKGLIDALKTEKDYPLPPVMVLNACSSASSDEVETGRPLAAGFVEAGVPIVVGMSGRVSDQACRLFTKGFYKSLLQDGQFSRSAAIGRRAALRLGGQDPRTSKDWTLPTLFLSEEFQEPCLQLSPTVYIQERHKVAVEFSPPDFPVFCGRLDLFTLYDQLMAGKLYKDRQAGRGSSYQVIAVSSKQDDTLDPKVVSPRYGRTWLVRELAAQAFRDGHIPVLISKDVFGIDQYPKSLLEYFEKMVKWAPMHTLQRLKKIPLHQSLTWTCDYLIRLLSWPEGTLLDDTFPEELQNLVITSSGSPRDPRVLAAAYRLDLLRLLNAVRAQLPESEKSKPRLLLLLDDIHRMDMAGDVLELLGDFGAHSAPNDISAIFTHSDIPTEGQTTPLRTIATFLTNNSAWVYPVQLPGFHSNVRSLEADEYTKALLVYRHFLLYWKDGSLSKPLAISAGDDNKYVKWFIDTLVEKVQGIPSFLALNGRDPIMWFLSAPPDVSILRSANDEDALNGISEIETK